jgi:hypothetical protein
MGLYSHVWWLCFMEVRKGVSSRRAVRCAWNMLHGKAKGKARGMLVLDSEGHSSEEGSVRSGVSCGPVSP